MHQDSRLIEALLAIASGSGPGQALIEYGSRQHCIVSVDAVGERALYITGANPPLVIGESVVVHLAVASDQPSVMSAGRVIDRFGNDAAGGYVLSLDLQTARPAPRIVVHGENGPSCRRLAKRFLDVGRHALATDSDEDCLSAASAAGRRGELLVVDLRTDLERTAQLLLELRSLNGLIPIIAAVRQSPGAQDRVLQSGADFAFHDPLYSPRIARLAFRIMARPQQVRPPAEFALAAA